MPDTLRDRLGLTKYDPQAAAAAVEKLRTTRARRRQIAAESQSVAVSRRQYAGARLDRLAGGWTFSTQSADAELATSLTNLRGRSRALVRDASYAKRARTLVQNNVIGTGIGMQARVKASRGELRKPINDEIEEAFATWSEAKNCHTGGRLAFSQFERIAMGEVFEAGEVFIRKHPRRFGDSAVPFALELIEAERLVDEYTSPMIVSTPETIVRLGIELDRFYRPVAYWIRTRHPNETALSGDVYAQVERVPAEQIIHLALIDRWPQTRGEPWLHATLRRLNDMDGYSEAEIVRARAQAQTVGAIETPLGAESLGIKKADGSYELELQAGMLARLNPGEKMSALAPTAPNPALDPFMRYMLREVAAGASVSYESLSRDYSQSNYSSSRLALLDDRDLWRYFQAWFICEFRNPVHKEWLRQAVFAGAVQSVPLAEYALNAAKFEAVAFKPRGWSWVDPTKEVEAYKEAIRSGLTTRTDVISKTADGRDVEDIDEERAKELADAKALGLAFDTDPATYKPEQPKPAVAAPTSKPGGDDDDTDEGDDTARHVLPFKR